MVLLLQLNGDLPEHFPGHERRLYVLTCRRKTCRRKEGSIRVLRGVRISEDAAKAAAKPQETKSKETSNIQGQGKVVSSTGMGDSLFGTKPTSGGAGMFGGNPFATSSSSSTPSNPFSTSAAPNPFASTTTAALASKPPQKPIEEETETLPKTFASALSLNTPTPTSGPALPSEPWPADTAFPKPYPLYYLADADYEILDKVQELPNQRHEFMDIDEMVETGGGGKEDKDVYESSIDNTFQKFADRVGQNPEQVIRYEFRGQPLLYTKNDAVGKILAGSGSASSNVKVSASGSKVPRCGNCGAGRVFEVQLTPQAIAELESEELSLEGMEWGTIVVEVCEKDCGDRGAKAGEVGYVEEWAGVQWEEVAERRK
jgi:pre-rRNA-processing protein TSR4